MGFRRFLKEGHGFDAKRVGIMVVLGLSLFATAGFASVKQGNAEGDKATPTCTLATLKGRYLFANSGTILPPAFGVSAPTPGSDAGFHLFNGDGTGTDIVTVRINGEIALENFVTPVTYTVNKDCTGTITVPDGPTFGTFIAPNGDSFVSTATNSGNYPTGMNWRVSNK